MKLALQLLANGLVTGALYALLAAGFGLVWRTLRIFHVAFGALFIVSGYVFHVLVRSANLGFASATLLTILFAALMGWAFEVGLYRPFARREASSGAVLIASLGIYIAIENLAVLIFGNETLTVIRGTAGTVHIGPIILTTVQVLQVVAGYTMVFLLWILIRRLPVFTALWAMGDRPELIPVLGLPTDALRATALVLSSVLAAIAAILISLDIGTDPHFGMSYVLIAAVAVLSGGANSYLGWIVGAVILAILQSLVVWTTSARWMDLLTFGFLTAILLLRPRGLIDPSRRVEERA